ncbi:MAG: peptidase MA domain-containing protein, partial [Dehalococcoidales bacterium]|nr:peptidase MA domain-containing protein [Dehalococcoidales bacterium]
TGGAAFTRHGTIVIGISPINLYWGERAIAHEMAHLVIHQMILNPYSGLPTWLDEGLAMYAEGSLAPEYTAYLNQAIADDSLISVRSLSSPFSAYAAEAALSYAQSYSLVEFLISNYGQGKMLELLNTFSQGSNYDAALDSVYGFDMDGLDSLWQDYVTGQSPLIEETGMHPVLTGVLVALPVGFLLGLGLVIKYKAQGRGG